MYYTSETGTVKSFNYGTTSSNALTINGTTGTRELANENYGVCIAMLPGYCSIVWSQSTTDSFTVSGDTEANSDILGTQFAVVTGDQCTTDFVVIPAPYYINGSALNSDRFCGNAFPTVVCGLFAAIVLIAPIINCFYSLLQTICSYGCDKRKRIRRSSEQRFLFNVYSTAMFISGKSWSSYSNLRIYLFEIKNCIQTCSNRI